MVFVNPKFDQGSSYERVYWHKPLDIEKFRISYGIVHIIKDRCKRYIFYIEFCTNKVLEVSEVFNNKCYHPPKNNSPGRMCFV